MCFVPDRQRMRCKSFFCIAAMRSSTLLASSTFFEVFVYGLEANSLES